MPDLLAAVESLQQQQDTATLELSTGSRINRPSDDPAGAAELTRMHDLEQRVDSFESSSGSINGVLSTADSTLSSVVTALQRAISLGTEGANGTLSDSDRADVAAELSGIQDQLLSLANTSYQGSFIFAGTATTQPFVADPNSASGIRYAGNAGTNSVAIGTGYQLQINQPGSQIFNGPGADVFQSIHDLITALNTNSGIAAAVGEVGSAFSYVTSQRVFYGNAMNQIQTQQDYLSTEKVQLSTQENAAGAADMAGVASQVASIQTAANASLEAMGRIAQTSLFDYLR
jgi:flagellar hook-associated protein 3 FlgL